MSYERKDRFYKKAKKEGFRSRSAFKLLEIDSKFHIFRPGMLAVDLGCAPGGWIQVIARAIGPLGQVIGVDLETTSPIPERNASFITGDIRESRTSQRLLAELGRKVDLVVSDMSPHLSGIKFQDHYNSYELAEQALRVCKMILKEKGSFLVKIFPGEEFEKFKQNLKPSFHQIKTFIPDATRKTSTEVYVLAQGFRNTT